MAPRRYPVGAGLATSSRPSLRSRRRSTRARVRCCRWRRSPPRRSAPRLPPAQWSRRRCRPSGPPSACHLRPGHALADRLGPTPGMVDLVIDIDNSPGKLAEVAAAISDAGVNIAAATCVGPGERAELHILVPHAAAVKHLLAISHRVAITLEREVVVVDVEERPGVLADLTRKIARAGV